MLVKIHATLVNGKKSNIASNSCFAFCCSSLLPPFLPFMTGQLESWEKGSGKFCQLRRLPAKGWQVFTDDDYGGDGDGDVDGGDGVDGGDDDVDGCDGVVSCAIRLSSIPCSGWYEGQARTCKLHFCRHLRAQCRATASHSSIRMLPSALCAVLGAVWCIVCVQGVGFWKFQITRACRSNNLLVGTYWQVCLDIGYACFVILDGENEFVPEVIWSPPIHHAHCLQLFRRRDCLLVDASSNHSDSCVLRCCVPWITVHALQKKNSALIFTQLRCIYVESPHAIVSHQKAVNCDKEALRRYSFSVNDVPLKSHVI